jgi:hypothetical protein
VGRCKKKQILMMTILENPKPSNHGGIARFVREKPGV